MKVDQLRGAYHADPFQPFAFRLADGRRFYVPKWHLLGLAPDGRSAVVFGEGESYYFFDPELVIELEVPADPEPGDNGLNHST